MTSNTPRNLRYSKADAEKYSKLTQDNLSPFHGATFKDVFLYAATYGFRNSFPQELVKPQPNIPLSALNEDDIWILKAIAIAEHKSLDILGDPKETYHIAEKYANGALESIYLEVFGKAGEPYKRMSVDMLDEFERQ